MPAKEAQTLAERQSQLNEIKAFASMNTEALKRALVLDKFEALMKRQEPDNEHSWSFFDRSYLVRYSNPRATLSE